MDEGQNKAIWEDDVVREATIRGYSKKTIRAYVFHVRRFLGSGLDLRTYLFNMAEAGYKAQSIRSAGFAVKFYLKACGGIGNVPGSRDPDNCRESDTAISSIIPNFKRDKRLPVVLSQKEIEQMILSRTNTKHRLMIMLGYGAGLRVSEISGLRWRDVDFSRDLIHIKSSKGKKRPGCHAVCQTQEGASRTSCRHKARRQERVCPLVRAGKEIL